jgi:circadian clock protein KaiB
MRPSEVVKFRLYVAGDTQNSMQALANLTHICRTHLADRHEIEVVDVFKEPAQSLQDSIFMTPTLIKLSPLPMIKIIGTLSHTPILLQALGLDIITS